MCLLLQGTDEPVLVRGSAAERAGSHQQDPPHHSKDPLLALKQPGDGLLDLPGSPASKLPKPLPDQLPEALLPDQLLQALAELHPNNKGREGKKVAKSRPPPAAAVAQPPPAAPADELAPPPPPPPGPGIDPCATGGIICAAGPTCGVNSYAAQAGFPTTPTCPSQGAASIDT